MLAQNAAIKKRRSFKDWWSATTSEYGYIMLAALVPAVLFALIYLARGLYPFGDGTVLVLDLNGQYVYFFEYLKDAVLNGSSLLYSWSRSLGGEFLGMYAYYIASPLSYLICLFPSDKTQEFLLILFMIKASLCGGTMGFYLHKHSVNKNKLTVVAFSILYAMSAYCVVHMNNTMWMDAVMWLPLVAYGIEELVKYGKYKMFVIFLSLTLASNFYIGYMVCIFVLLYFFYYLAAYKENNVNNPYLEENHTFKSLVRIASYSLLAIGMAAVIVFGAYYSLQFGKNEFTDPVWEIFLRIDFFDIFFKMLPSSYDTVRIDGLPFIYCGLLTLLLAPLFFCSKKFTTREKIASGVFLLIFILSFSISVVDLVWHGFQKPQWLNNRYSFMFCFFLIFLAFRAFDHIEEISAKSIACVSAFIVGFVVILQNFAGDYIEKLEDLSYGPDDGKFEIHDFGTVLMTIIGVVAYVSIIAVMKKAKNRDLVAAVLIGVICTEVFLSGLTNVNDFDEDVGFTKYYKYNDFKRLMEPVTDTLADYDTGFYRAEITNRRKDNDNFALGLRGLTSTTSTLNKDTINFLHNMGYYGASHRTRYEGASVVNDALLGVKYIITPRDYSDIYGEPVLSLEDYAAHEGMTTDEFLEATYSDEYKNISADKLNVYLNPFALSLAFGATDAIYDVNFREQNHWVDEEDERYNPDGYTSPFTRINALITAILGEDETVEVFKPATQNGDPLVSDDVTASVSSEHNKYVSTSNAGDVTYHYTAPEGYPLYLYFPAYYNRAIKLKLYEGHHDIPGISKITDPAEKKAKEDALKESALTMMDNTSSLNNCNERIVELCFTENTQYTINVTINNSNKQFYTKPDDSFVYYVDTDLLAEVVDRIREEELVITKFKDHDIRGTMTTLTDNKTVLTSIPYDKGWQVYVDGKKVETREAASALLTFEVASRGDHDIRLVYRSAPIVYGTIITVTSYVGFILIMIFEDKLKKVKVIRAFYVVEEPVDETQTTLTKKK